MRLASRRIATPRFNPTIRIRRLPRPLFTFGKPVATDAPGSPCARRCRTDRKKKPDSCRLQHATPGQYNGNHRRIHDWPIGTSSPTVTGTGGAICNKEQREAKTEIGFPKTKQLYLLHCLQRAPNSANTHPQPSTSVACQSATPSIATAWRHTTT